MDLSKNHARRLGRTTLLTLVGALLTMVSTATFAQANLDWQPPAFTLERADGTAFNYPKDLSSPTVILFWATWCPYCKALMPHLQSVMAEFPGEIEVLALSIHDDGDPAAVLAEYGYGFQSFGDADSVADAWGVKGTPGLFLADAHGRVVFDRLRMPSGPKAANEAELKHYQKAARRAPLWAAGLRRALDQVRFESPD